MKKINKNRIKLRIEKENVNSTLTNTTHRLIQKFQRYLNFEFISGDPYHQLILGYLYYIILGMLLMMIPITTTSNIRLIDQLFTVTSAISTTGLATVDVSSQYTFWGQLVILLLIQAGGIGYMTMTSFVIYRMTKQFTMIKTGLLKAEFSTPANIKIGSLVQSIIGFTLLFEFLGSLTLYLLFLHFGVEKPLWSAIFHSVSAFCTAGFSIYPDNWMQFKTNWSVNLVIMTLSYAGAMGFIVMLDVWNKIKNKSYQISFTTKIILLITFVITLFGTSQLFFFESSFEQYPWYDRLQMALFQTMSAMTTVGYNSVDIGQLIPISLMALIVAMYLGASPSGTGGGLKSTTTSAIYAYTISKMGKQRDIYLLGRRLPSFRVETALSTFIIYTVFLFTGTYLLMATESYPLEQLLFEAASALGTVGLTTGITFNLTSAGKLILIILMFVGRVGVLSIGYAMLTRMKEKSSKVIKEDDLAV